MSFYLIDESFMSEFLKFFVYIFNQHFKESQLIIFNN
jgi:hypothetical protein